MTAPQSPRDLDALAIITHAAREGVPVEDYLRTVARVVRVKTKKIGTGLRHFEEDAP
jgi:hypothetical protein